MKNAASAGTRFVCRPATHRARAPCRRVPAVPPRCRRDAAQRPDPRHYRGGPLDEAFIARARGIRRAAEHVKSFARKRWRRSAASMRDAARGGARCRHLERLDDLVGHGHQPARSRHRQRACLIALTMVTGQIGSPGTGLHPLRGQNNVQGACDAGLIPMCCPTTSASPMPACARASRRLGHARSIPSRGSPWSRSSKRREDARRSAACTSRARTRPCPTPTATMRARRWRARSPRRAGHLPHRDGLSRRRGAAGDGVAGEDRHRDQHRPHGAARPQGAGAARRRAPDLWIIQEMAPPPRPALARRRRSRARSTRRCAADAVDRRHLVGAAGARRRGHLPVRGGGRPRASRVVFIHHSRRPTDGALRARRLIPAAERPDADYPLVLITGRQLEHWHTGSMTRRATMLDALEPDPVASIRPARPAPAQARAGRRAHGAIAPRRIHAVRARRRGHRRAARCSFLSASTRRRPTG